jgi:hypothetical protein
MGRWTEPKTFRNHYQAPVKLESLEAPPAAMKVNVQQVLRWGFRQSPPPNVSAEECMQGPNYWVGQTFGSALSILSFDEGIYSTATAGVFPPVAGSRADGSGSFSLRADGSGQQSSYLKGFSSLAVSPCFYIGTFVFNHYGSTIWSLNNSQMGFVLPNLKCNRYLYEILSIEVHRAVVRR